MYLHMMLRLYWFLLAKLDLAYEIAYAPSLSFGSGLYLPPAIGLYSLLVTSTIMPSIMNNFIQNKKINHYWCISFQNCITFPDIIWSTKFMNSYSGLFAGNL